MVFHPDDYSAMTAMHCNTEEKAKRFLRLMHSHGKKWVSDDSYLNTSFYNVFKEDTVYYFNRGTYGSRRTAVENGRKILSFDDFDGREEQVQPEISFEAFLSASDQTTI